jgi:hypothetical protein
LNTPLNVTLKSTSKDTPLKNLLIHPLIASSWFSLISNLKEAPNPALPPFYPNFAAQTSPMYTHIPLSISLGKMVTNKRRNKNCLANDRTKYGPNMPSVFFGGRMGCVWIIWFFYCSQCLINNGKCYSTLEGDPSLELLSWSLMLCASQ